MSVLASFMSAITLLGTPAEVYRYGTQYVIINLTFLLVIPSTAYLYLPVFYNLKITSAYEYLELRYSRTVRTMGTVVFWFHMMMYMPVVLYAPALALAEVTGVSIWFSVLSVGLVCTLYTGIGGMKAVVITDFFQSIIMYGSVLVIVIKGTYDLGGIDVVWERSLHGGRIEFFNFNMDPTIRHTFWSLVVGGYFTWMGNYAANQAMIQRYLTIGTLRGAQWCLWINLPALILLIIITSLAGLVIYAFYFSCDPIGAKLIHAPDQLFPRFVMETLSSLPGIPGLFVSGIFSGALSTVSSGVNSLAAVTLEDIIKTYIWKNITELWATRVTKILAMVYGLLSILLVLVAERLGGVLQVALTIHGIVGGPMLGIFTLGMFFPWSNSIGSPIGLLGGFVISMWVGLGAFVAKPFQPEGFRSYQNCSDLYRNITGAIGPVDEIYITPPPDADEVLYPYRLSYIWVSTIGFFVTVFIGLIISSITNCYLTEKDDVDDRLLSPFVVWLKKRLSFGKDRSLDLHPNIAKNTSMTTLKSASVISDDSFYPTKKISCISDSFT